MTSKDHRGIRAFTFLETIVSVGITALLVVGTGTLINQQMDYSREEETIAKLSMLKRALIGDPRIVTKEARTDFGLLGDMGSLPSSSEELWIAGSQPSYTFDTSLKVGRGWTGPYLDVEPLRFFDQIALDAWGNPIQYVVETATSATTGQEYRARIFSYGPDADVGGTDDLTTEIYTTQMLSTVVGYVRDSAGNPLEGVGVKVNHPTDGVLVEQSTETDSAGAYTFTSIPFGVRSLAIDPGLIYVNDSGVTLNSGSDVEFVVQNHASSDVTITSFKAEYSVTAFYEKLEIGSETVFDNSSNRAASGETLNFSGQTLVGTGSTTGRLLRSGSRHL